MRGRSRRGAEGRREAPSDPPRMRTAAPRGYHSDGVAWRKAPPREPRDCGRARARVQEPACTKAHVCKMGGGGVGVGRDRDGGHEGTRAWECRCMGARAGNGTGAQPCSPRVRRLSVQGKASAGVCNGTSV